MTDRGSSLVEFVLLFPLLVALIAGLFFVALTGLRQIVLTYEAQRLARRLAENPAVAAPTGVSVRLRAVPQSRVEVLELSLTRNKLTVHASDVRIKEAGR